MKKFFAIFVVCLALVTTTMDADAARRFGGGSSFGRSAPTFSQKAPAPKAAPKAPQQQNAGAQQRQQNNAAAPAPAAKPSMMRSVLTGMAAALGITALLSMLGLDGSAFASILTGLLMAMAVFFIFRLVMGMLAQRRANPNGGAATMQRPPVREEVRPEPMPRQAYTEPVAGTRQGSVMDQFSQPANVQIEEGTRDITPDDFDREGFLTAALENYRKLQKAWDTGNVVEISDFTTQDIFIAVTHQLRERGHEVYQSEILELNNKLLGIAEEENVYVAVVEFHGKVVVSGEEEDINETWMLEKPVKGEGGWLLAGIKQNDAV